MRALFAPLTSSWRWRWLAVALLLGASCIVQAQDAAPPDDGGAGDPPSRVARLSYREGDVGLLPAGEKEWGDASLNRPLTTGDRLSTGKNAHAELQLGGGSLRIADDSDFGFLSLNDQLTQVELTQGTLNLNVKGLAEGQSYEIDTPTVALVVDQPGNYRVDISEDGKSTRVTDFQGRATVYGEANAQRLIASGRSYEFSDSSLNAVSINNIDGGDDFDAWCNSREQRYGRSPSSQYVSDEVVGAQDLDRYGNWQADPDYGQVWYPATVGVDWAPYRDGHWAYVAPWGWTWVDDSPWGFAPYHYGRWAYVRNRWGWVPGPISVRPVYAPALVAFVGGAGFSVAVGVGGGPVGWFPLGPGEVYNPWYHVSRNYYTNVNVTNIYVRNDRNVVINNINNHYNYFRDGRAMPNEHYFNRQAPHAFTAMSSQDFAAARNARQHMASVDPARVAAAPVMARGVALQPGRASFAPPRPADGRSLPQGGFQREVVARHAPLAAALALHPTGAANAPRNVQGPAPTNVRMLNDLNPGNRPAMAGRPAEAPAMDRAEPAARGGAGVRQPAAPDNAMRPGELPSARFARPQPSDNRVMPADRPNQANQPRPGVSYIPNAAEDRSQHAQPQPGTLPNTPRIERAQPYEGGQENAQRYPRESSPRPTPQEQPRYVPSQREEQPRNMPPREEQSRNVPAPREEQPRYVPPHREEQPRNAPPPREEQPRYVPPQREPQPQPQQQREPPRGYETSRGNPAPQAQPQPRPAQPAPQPQQHPQTNQNDRHPPHKDEQHN